LTNNTNEQQHVHHHQHQDKNENQNEIQKSDSDQNQQQNNLVAEDPESSDSEIDEFHSSMYTQTSSLQLFTHLKETLSPHNLSFY
jgi:hypothetical protein